MTRAQKKRNLLRARKRNRMTVRMPKWERRFRQRWVAACILGLVGMVVMQWIVRALALGFPERPLALALGWLLAAGLALFLRVRV